MRMNFLELSLKPKLSIWWYILAIILAFVVSNTLGIIPLVSVIIVKIGLNGELGQIGNIMDPHSVGISTNLFLALMLFAFVLALAALLLFIWAFNKKNYKQIINGTNQVRWNRIFWGFGVWVVLSFIVLVIDYFFLSPSTYTLQFNLMSFIPLLLI